MRNVIIITYNHRPFHDPGSSSARERSYAYEQFLPSFGWRPIIVCSDYATRRQGLPPPTQAEVERGLSEPDKAAVFATSSRESGGIFESAYRHLMSTAVPGVWQKPKALARKMCVLGCLLTSGDVDACHWEYHAQSVLSNIVRAIDVHACLASHSPHTSMRLGDWLCRKYHIPWLLEFRDPWSLGFESSVSRWAFSPVMRRLAASVSALAAVSEPLAQNDHRFFRRDAHVLRNGYNPLDYTSVQPACFDKFSIVYTGSVNACRRIDLFFQALRVLLDRDLVSPGNFGFYYCGLSSQLVQSEADRAGVATLTHIEGIMPRDLALGWQLGADVILHLTWPKQEKGFFSGKIFEYLYARRNILAIPGDDGVVDSLLQETRAGVSLGHPEAIAAQLASWMREKSERGHVPYYGLEDEIAKYDRRACTRELATILDGISR